MRKFLSTPTLAVFVLAGALAVSYTLIRAPHTFGQEMPGLLSIRDTSLSADGAVLSVSGTASGGRTSQTGATCTGFRNAGEIETTETATPLSEPTTWQIDNGVLSGDFYLAQTQEGNSVSSCTQKQLKEFLYTFALNNVNVSSLGGGTHTITLCAADASTNNPACDSTTFTKQTGGGFIEELALPNKDFTFQGIIGDTTAPAAQTLTILNRAQKPDAIIESWQAIDFNASPSATPWCELLPASGGRINGDGGRTTAQVRVKPPVEMSAGAGTYTCTFKVRGLKDNADVKFSPQTITVSYNITVPVGQASMSLDKNALAFNAVTGGAPVPASQTLKVINALTATANLSWNAVKTTGNGCSYFTFAPISRSDQAPGDSTSVLLEASPAASSGIYTCQVRFTGVSDGSGQTADGSPKELNLTYNVSDVPAPTCTLSKTAVAVGEPVSATAAGGNGTYAWSVSPDGTPNPAQGATTSIAFPTAGTKTVTVQSGGKNGTCSLTVNNALSCTLSAAPNPVTVNNPTTLSAQGFGGGGGYTYKYNCTANGPFTSSSPICTYTTVGSKTPYARVTDSGGATATCTTAPTAVEVMPAPTLSATLEVATDATAWSSSVSRAAPFLMSRRVRLADSFGKSDDQWR